MVEFAGWVLSRHVAPRIEEFKSANIPDMEHFHSESSYWVTNHFLNSALRAELRLPAGAYVFNYLRRAEGAFSEHSKARTATYRYLQLDQPAPSFYAAAILHWEFFVSQSWQGYALLQKLIQRLTGDDDFRVFESGDGSVEQRLWLLYNSMKHVESRIASRQILDDTVSPVWLSNSGLECTDGVLSFSETRDVLCDLAKWADIVVDPYEMAEKLRRAA